MKLLPLFLPLALVAVGCGGGSKSEAAATTTGSAGAVIRTIDVSLTEFKIDPATITIDAAGTYVFDGVNHGKLTHALELEGDGVEAKTGDIAPGASGELRVEIPKAGEYELYCPIDGHRDQGMESRVVLAGAGGSGGGTTTTESTPAAGGYGY